MDDLWQVPVNDATRPDPEAVELARAAIKRQQERNLWWIKHCKRLLEEGESDASQRL